MVNDQSSNFSNITGWLTYHVLQEPLEKKNSSVPFLISLPFASLQSADGERDIKRYDQVEAACTCMCMCACVCCMCYVCI